MSVETGAEELVPVPVRKPSLTDKVAQFFTAHPKGFYFFFWGEFAERCSYYGMRVILAKYMTDALGIAQDNAGTYLAFFSAAVYFLPLLGGWVADNLFGKYWTIVGFSLPYILGHVIIGFENKTCFIVALGLLAMGSGVIKPNISTLMGLTYDQYRPGETKLRSDAFAMFYFAINVGAALSQLTLPKIRSSYSYQIAFLFPALLMVLAFIVFAAGKKYYAIEPSAPKEKTPEERAEQWRVLGRIFGLFVLVMFFWAIFDQATSTWIFFTEACMNRNVFGYLMDADQMQGINPVLIMALLPPITLLWKYLDRKGFPVRPTDKMLIGFGLTAGCMAIMALAAFLAGNAESRPALAEAEKDHTLTLFAQTGDKRVAIDKITKIDATSPDVIVGSYTELDPETNRPIRSVTVTLTGEGVQRLVAPGEEKIGQLNVEGDIRKLVETVKEGNGPPTKTVLLEGSVRAIIQGDMDVNRRWFVDPEKQVTVWWLVIAYIVITIAEVCISVTGLELAYTAAPKSMTGFVTACWLLTVALANLLINAPITRLYTRMQPMMYFAMLTGMLLVVSVAFVFTARRFNRSTEQAAAG